MKSEFYIPGLTLKILMFQFLRLKFFCTTLFWTVIAKLTDEVQTYH